MKLKAFIALLLIALVNCNLKSQVRGKEVPYLRDGISFSVAEGWEITANDSIGEKAYYFSAERSGTKSTGLITVTWANKVEDPEYTILVHQQSMKNANIYRNPGIEFAAITPDNFGSQKVLTCNYTTIVKELKLIGTIYCFNTAGENLLLYFSRPDLTTKRLTSKQLISSGKPLIAENKSNTID